MDKVASLRAFVKVVESGSFAEAGRQLRLSRSAISKYIADLEESLGVQLLNRTTRHASPTENGQTLFRARASSILSETRGGRPGGRAGPVGAERTAPDQRADVVRHAAAGTCARRFHGELSRAVKLQLVLSDDLLDPVQDGFDVTLRIAELESSSLIARKIMPIDRA